MIRRLKLWRQLRRRRKAIEWALAALPVNNGTSLCDDCYAAPGERHELSCDEVSLEQMRAVANPEGSDR